MSQTSKLTEEEKENGKRKFLAPLDQTLADTEFYLVDLEDFKRLVERAIPPSPQPDQAAK